MLELRWRDSVASKRRVPRLSAGGQNQSLSLSRQHAARAKRVAWRYLLEMILEHVLILWHRLPRLRVVLLGGGHVLRRASSNEHTTGATM